MTGGQGAEQTSHQAGRALASSALPPIAVTSEGFEQCMGNGGITLETGNAALIHHPSPQHGVGAIKFHLASGVRNESSVDSGVHHLLEHVYSKLFLEQILAVSGKSAFGNFQAATDFDGVTFSWHGKEEHVSKVLLALEQSFLKGASVPPRIFDAELSVTEVELASRASRIGVRQLEDLISLLYPDSHLRNPVAGDMRVTLSLTRDQLHQKLNEIIHTQGWAFSVVGGARSDAAALVERQALSVTATRDEDVPSAVSRNGPRLLFRERPGEIASLAIGFPVPTVADPFHIHVELLARMMKDIAQAELRENAGIIYEPVRELRVDTKTASVYGMSIQTTPKKIAQAFAHLNRVVLDIAGGGFSQALFEETRERLLSNIAYASTLASSVAGFSLDRYLERTLFCDFEELACFVASITPDSLSSVGGKVFSLDQEQVVVYGGMKPDLGIASNTESPFFATQ